MISIKSIIILSIKVMIRTTNSQQVLENKICIVRKTFLCKYASFHTALLRTVSYSMIIRTCVIVLKSMKFISLHVEKINFAMTASQLATTQVLSFLSPFLPSFYFFMFLSFYPSLSSASLLPPLLSLFPFSFFSFLILYHLNSYPPLM